jgi:hypothetical protein
LKENQAWRGGAIYVEGGELHFFQCRFTDNQVTGEGGAIFQAGASLEAHNCLFAANHAASDGGAVFSDLGDSDFFNCSFGNNHSAWRGGAIYDYVAVTTRVGNCIFWGNSDQTGFGEGAQIFLNPTNSLYIDYTCLQGWTGEFGGEGNIGNDPILADLLNGDLHLLAGSPCIDSGSNELVGTQLDLDGNLRIVNDCVDMGCYEFQEVTGVQPVSQDFIPSRILYQNFPNPFNPVTTIRLNLPVSTPVTLIINDMSGRLIRSLVQGETIEAGWHEVIWYGKDATGKAVPSGVYFYRLTAGDYVETRRMTLVK